MGNTKQFRTQTSERHSSLAKV
ncbi:unnamed protein product, partial [Rotaria magnacalcarata]